MAFSPTTSWQTEVGKVKAVTDFLFLGSKITVDGDCSHKIKRCLLPVRKAMTDLDNVLKIRDIDKSPLGEEIGRKLDFYRVASNMDFGINQVMVIVT